MVPQWSEEEDALSNVWSPFFSVSPNSDSDSASRPCFHSLSDGKAYYKENSLSLCIGKDMIETANNVQDIVNDLRMNTYFRKSD